jgi:hypothetical protein
VAVLLKQNKKLPMSGDFDTDVKTVLDVFEAESIKTKKDMDDYGKEEHVLNPIIEKLLQEAVAAAGGPDGFLMDDELADFEAALAKVAEKNSKRKINKTKPLAIRWGLFFVLIFLIYFYAIVYG